MTDEERKQLDRYESPWARIGYADIQFMIDLARREDKRANTLLRMDAGELDEVLERWDQTEPAIQRSIAAKFGALLDERTAEVDVLKKAAAVCREALVHAKAVAWEGPAHRDEWEERSQKIFDKALDALDRKEPPK